MTDAEVDDLGGLDLLCSALRTAARSLGWSKTEAYGVTTIMGAVAGVVDRREVSEEFAEAVDRHKMARMRAAVETVARNRADSVRRAVPGSGALTTQEFQAALAAVPQSRSWPAAKGAAGRWSPGQWSPWAEGCRVMLLPISKASADMRVSLISSTAPAGLVVGRTIRSSGTPFASPRRSASRGDGIRAL